MASDGSSLPPVVSASGAGSSSSPQDASSSAASSSASGSAGIATGTMTIPPGVDPFFYAQHKFDCQQFDACIEVCTHILRENQLDRAVWMLKARALTEKNWIDDTEMEEEGVAELLMDDHALSQLPR